jgi:hypothetical protein
VDWKAQNRKHIYLHSSDVDIFKGIAGDITDAFIQMRSRVKELAETIKASRSLKHLAVRKYILSKMRYRVKGS